MAGMRRLLMNLKLALCLALVLSADMVCGQAVARSQVPREVLAFYYPWYGVDTSGDKGRHWGNISAARHEISDSTHFPARGAYDSHDPALIASQIELAQAHGLTGFIVSWWGRNTYEDEAVPLMLRCAEQKHFKISVYWEQVPDKGAAQTAHAMGDLAYLAAQLGTNKAFLKVGGKPVIFVYGRVLSQIPKSSWSAIISGARAKAGLFLLMADEYEEPTPQLFAGLHQYSLPWAVADRSPDRVRAWAAQYDGNEVKFARQTGRISCVTVIPGYDDTKIRKPGHKVERRQGQLYGTLWEEAIRASPDWILITSWNEWHEGTEIEPSLEDGDKYLGLTAGYAARFLRQKP
jgi:hypothetical protein